MLPPGLVLVGRAGGRGRNGRQPEPAHTVGSQAVLTTSEEFNPPMNGVLVEEGYQVRVQHARESPPSEGETVANRPEKLFDVTVLGTGFKLSLAHVATC